MRKEKLTCEFCGQKETIPNEYWYYELVVYAFAKFDNLIGTDKYPKNCQETHYICEDCYNHLKKV